MKSDFTRSEQVIEAFKRQKLASSVFKQIHRVIEGFEEDEKLDRQIAEVGLVSLSIVVALSVCLMKIF
jgi:hypothetical protein